MATKKKSSETKTMAACTRDLRVRVAPACGLPQDVIDAMVAAGARKDEVEGEDLRVLRTDGMDSPAWKVYRCWACSLGEVDPLVHAIFDPSIDIQRSPSSPPETMGIPILREANSIINHVAPLLIADFLPVGIPALPGPLPRPLQIVNIHHAKVAVTALLEAIANPGANYAVINALHSGTYICDVVYQWRGGSNITVPVHKR